MTRRRASEPCMGQLYFAVALHLMTFVICITIGVMI